MERQKTAVIVGAGPAGLTAAYELITRTNIQPIVLEKDPTYVGGIARTITHNGNRIDIGGHRFFSKSDRVMNWWLSILPLEKRENSADTITYHSKTRAVTSEASAPDPSTEDRVMMVRPRLSRIFYNGSLFEYPIQPSFVTFRKLGFWKTVIIGLHYLYRVMFPIRPEKTLEDFYINRFGRELYETFFKTYTEKVWGVPCKQISAEWGAQRVKGLSIGKAIKHFLTHHLVPQANDIAQKNTETSLIEQFMYPKYGPGHLWETVRDEIVRRGGVVRMGMEAKGMAVKDGAVVAVSALSLNGDTEEFPADYVFSTMPIVELIQSLASETPPHITEIANGLPYRDFITIGLLLDRLSVGNENSLTDTWMYIHDPNVHMCRIQFFNNWSPYLVKKEGHYWIGLEYIVHTKDPLWAKSDKEIMQSGIAELVQLGFIEESAVKDSVVIRMEKTYPAYFGTYDRFSEIRGYLNTFPNLFPIGRNGMHRYNNQDHSMLTAMTAVDNIIEGRTDKTNLWEINTEEEYHEERK